MNEKEKLKGCLTFQQWQLFIGCAKKQACKILVKLKQYIFLLKLSDMT